MTNTPEYATELQYLVDYAKADWVGFSPIVGAASSLTKSDYTREKLTTKIMELVTDLLDSGAMAGDLTASETEPFVAWPVSRENAIRRIETEMRNLPDFPNSGEICFFAIPDPA